MSGNEISNTRPKLSPAQQALLEKRLRQARTGQAKASAIPRHSYQGAAPLSFGQEWFWFCFEKWSHGDPGPIYIMPIALLLKGNLDVAALDQSINEVIRRHESLRTTFRIQDGQYLQVIAPALTLRLPSVDLRDMPKEAREAEARRVAFAEARRLFDLTQGPLIRVTLIHLADEEYVLLLIMHHIITDGWSMAVLTQEVAALYEAFSKGKPSPLPEMAIQYPDYSIWQREHFQGAALDAQLAYWERQLAGAPLVLNLPIDKPRPPVQTSNGGRENLVFAKSLAAALTDLSRKEKSTLFMTLLAAFNALLHRYTGQEDIIVGSPVAGRNRADVEGLIGYFANNLALRTDLSGDPSFQELLQRVRDTVLAAFVHQDMPFVLLVKSLQPEQDLSRSPVVQVLFVLENTPPLTLKFSDLDLDFLSVSTGRATRDLSLVVTEEAQEMTATFIYNTDLFEADTIKEMTAAFQTLLEKIAADPHQRLSELVRDCSVA